jgi:hypothetical protein
LQWKPSLRGGKVRASGRPGLRSEEAAMRRTVATALSVVVVLSALVILPVLAAMPDKAAKAEKAPISISGTVEVATDAGGHETYTLKANGKTYTLEAGPPWFFGDKYPLKKFVGQNVKIDGEAAKDSTDVEVTSVNGTALREPGRPPWAGGWKVVGAAHPGWSQAKADRMKAKFGDCFPPGKCKDKPGHAAGGADEPDESEAPGD